MRILALAALVLASGSVHLSATGRIGPLHLDRSTRAEVVAFAGTPQVEAHMYGYFQKGDPLDALGYSCAGTYRSRGIRLAKGKPPCLDVFWIDVRTGKLGNAYLAGRRFVDAHGIRVGTSSATAERLLHQTLVSGCTDALREGEITLLFDGGHMVVAMGQNHVVGAHVSAFVLDGHQRTGLFECW